MGENKIFQVSEFNEFVNNYLGEIGEVVVEGEISEIKVSQGKWLFLTIKDEESSVDIFSLVFRIRNYGVLEEGMLVHIYGVPRLYKKSGRFSLFASQIVPAGEGALRIAFEKLKLKLEKEGLFDEGRKRPLPIFPEKIGLITAKNSQAYSDFIKVLGERMGGIKIYFYPVLVQGRGSVESILQAFEYFNKNLSDLDLLILTRGGGSLEDLLAFNDEQVARAIFSSKIPVVCGIGHEKDVSLADFVADKRASTPSNAAELIVREKIEALRQIRYSINIIESQLRSKVDYIRQYQHLIVRIENRLKENLKTKGQIINQAVVILKEAIVKKINGLHQLIYRFDKEFSRFSQSLSFVWQKANNLKSQLIRANDFWLRKKKAEIDSLARLLKNLDYKRVLKRGFSITIDNQGRIIKTTKQVCRNKDIISRLFDGKIYSKVFSTEADRLPQDAGSGG